VKVVKFNAWGKQSVQGLHKATTKGETKMAYAQKTIDSYMSKKWFASEIDDTLKALEHRGFARDDVYVENLIRLAVKMHREKNRGDGRYHEYQFFPRVAINTGVLSEALVARCLYMHDAENAREENALWIAIQAKRFGMTNADYYAMLKHGLKQGETA
jgi:hypothetical protein